MSAVQSKAARNRGRRHMSERSSRVRGMCVLAAFVAVMVWCAAPAAASVGNWTVTGSETTTRGLAPTTTLLPSGQVLVAGGATPGSSCTPLASAELYSPTTGKWTSTGAMLVGRIDASATLLPNGEVLVSGGDTGSCTGAPTTEAELYNPATGSWTTAGSLTTARAYAQMTLLPSGLVLAVGGLNGLNTTIASAELYNPSSNTWSATGSMGTSRYDFAITVLGNGKVLAVGGRNIVAGSSVNVVASSELYDPSAGTWSTSGSMSTPRFVESTTLLPSGQVLAAGGVDGNGNSLASAELYNPSSGSWSSTGSMASANESGTNAPLLPDGLVLSAGGGSNCTDAELYNPSSGSWSVTSALTTGHCSSSALVVLPTSGQVLAACYTDVELYTPAPTTAAAATVNWSQPSAQYSPGTGATPVLLANGQVLVAGGQGEYSGQGSPAGELYNPASQTWTATAPMSVARGGATATLLPNGLVLVAGGNTDDASNDATATAELYNPATGSWTTTGSMSTARSYATATLLPNGQVLVAGGVTPSRTGPAYPTTTELYTPSSGTWSTTGSLVTNRAAVGSAVLLGDGTVLFATGQDAELYKPSSGTWTETGALLQSGSDYGGQLVKLANGQVLYTDGGSGDSELYSPAVGTWAETGSRVQGLSGFTRILLPNGSVLIAGGTHNGYDTNDAELYNPVTGAWSETQSVPFATDGSQVVLLPNGQVLSVGGDDSYGDPLPEALYAPSGPAQNLSVVVAPASSPHAAQRGANATVAPHASSTYTVTATVTDYTGRPVVGDVIGFTAPNATFGSVTAGSTLGTYVVTATSSAGTPVVSTSDASDLPSVSTVAAPSGTITDGTGNAYGPVTLTEGNQVTCSSSAPCTWSVASGTLPAGLSLSAASADQSDNGQTQTISGTPTKVLSNTVTIAVTQGGTVVSDFVVTFSDIENLDTSAGIGSFPTGMAADATNGKVYVAAADSNAVDAITASANPLTGTVSPLGFSAGQLNYPVSVAFGANTVFASNFESASAAQIAVPGAATGKADPLGCSQQEGVSEDSSGNALFVACYGSGERGTVAEMPVAGGTVKSFKLQSSGNTAPSGAAQNGTANDVAVADSATSQVATVNASSGVVGTTPTAGSTGGLPSGAIPANIAFASVGGTNFDYVADPGTGQFSVINEATATSPQDVADITLPAGPNASQPYGIATNAAGTTLIVSDSNNARAMVYSLSHSAPYATLLYVIGLPGSAVPDGVADMTVGGTNLAFIGDEAGNTVTIIDPPGVADTSQDSGSGPASAGGAGNTAGDPVVPVTLGMQAPDPAGTAVAPSTAAADGDALAPPPASKPSAGKPATGTAAPARTHRKHRKRAPHHRRRSHRRRGRRHSTARRSGRLER